MARVLNSRRGTAAAEGTSPRKYAKQARSLAVVESLLRATARILVRDGYAALTTNAVAALAGVSVGSLYQYFPNKEALVSALIAEHVEHSLTRFRAEALALMPLPVEQALPRFVRVLLELHRVDPALHRVFAEQLSPSDYPNLASSLEQGILLARAYLAAHAHEILPKDLDVAAFVVVHTAESLTHAAVLMRPDLLQSAQLEEEISACLVRYLKGERT